MSINVINVNEVKVVTKPWGHEKWIADGQPNFKYALKEIFLKAGNKSSLQFHRYKQETNFIQSGTGLLHMSEIKIDPDKFENNILLKNLEDFKNSNNQFIFHAGTKSVNGQYYSNGGRVLNFVSLDDNFKSARHKSLNLIKKLNWENGHYRNDIGFKVINCK